MGSGSIHITADAGQLISYFSAEKKQNNHVNPRGGVKKA